MAAVTTAARHGAAVNGCVLFSTTFPCHDCAKHIVASGIRRVVYVEPYPKSLVQELFHDSISVDTHRGCEGRVMFEPFVGIAPNKYPDVFAVRDRKRKNTDGSVSTWRKSEAFPHLSGFLPSPLARLMAEQEEVASFRNSLSKSGIRPEEA